MPGFKQYDELPSYYGLAGAFIHASTSEQWGLVVNEAAASGLPLIVSNRVGCVPELVVDGSNGYVFDPFDSGALTSAMLKIAGPSNDRTAMGQKSRDLVGRIGPSAFAKGLKSAVDTSLGTKAPKASILDRALIAYLRRT